MKHNKVTWGIYSFLLCITTISIEKTQKSQLLFPFSGDELLHVTLGQAVYHAYLVTIEDPRVEDGRTEKCIEWEGKGGRAWVKASSI